MLESGLDPELMYAAISAADERHASKPVPQVTRPVVIRGAAAARSDMSAFAERYDIPRPRSWAKDTEALWQTLPWGIRKVISERFKQMESRIQAATEEAASLRKKLKGYQNGATEEAA